MRKSDRFDIQAILKEAMSAEYHEAYRTLYKKSDCRIGVIARYRNHKSPRIFLEVLVNMCPSLGKIDPQILKKSAAFLEGLQRRGFSLTCQDSNFVSCEAEVSTDRVMAEYHAILSLKRKFFQRR